MSVQPSSNFETLERWGLNPKLRESAIQALEKAAIHAHREVALGRVVRHDGVALRIVTEDGIEQYPTRKSMGAAVVGDWVIVIDGVVEEILPRYSLLRRRDEARDTEQRLAANVDLVLVVLGLDRPISPPRIQRATMLAHEAGIPAMVVLTKVSLVENPLAAVALVESHFPEVPVFAVDSVTGEGLAELAAQLSNQSVVLLGESGSGKSSLTNGLSGEVRTAVGEVRAKDAKGRHTTTWRELHPLENGTIIIDSPGIRSIGIWAEPEAVSVAFPDVEELADHCRFNDCTHTSEPGCAVQTAIKAGDLTPLRLSSWREITKSQDPGRE